MKITQAQVRNFRILSKLDIDFEDVLSLVIGKNNSGKTSFLVILEKFLSENKPEFTFDDFSIEQQKNICSLESTEKSPQEYVEPSLSLKLYISYDENDDIADASALLLDLNGDNNQLVVLFEYVLTYEKYLNLVQDYKKHKESGIRRPFEYFVSKHIKRFFGIRIRALEYGNENNSKDINSISSIISMKTIGARRTSNNEEGRGKSLSTLAYRFYNSKDLETEFPELQQELQKTDENLTDGYAKLFSSIISEIKRMSYNPKEAEIAIISSLSDQQIFLNNTTVKYKHGEALLPEDYNGLGYLNLIEIVFDLRIKLDLLSKSNNASERPTPINLLFIEEPEAHTHPQMQYIFIKNIKDILKDHIKSVGPGFALQTIISTHSAHIVSQCDFDDIKYLYRKTSTSNSVSSRSLKTLHSKMVTSTEENEQERQEKNFRFVKQYVTLNRSELFFADKVILIEGDTERMLLAAMMKKFDNSNKDQEGYIPLLSQNISIIEVGAYSHIFSTFLGFVGIKTLIFTDLDCAKENENNRAEKSPYCEATTTTNASIKHFTGKNKINEIVALTDDERTYSYNSETSKWVHSEDGNLRLLFQKEENGYQATSFEDAFLCCNLNFVENNKEHFEGLKNRNKLQVEAVDYYALSNDCIDSKTTFALDILMYGGKENEAWNLPLYIREGFEWLVM